MNKTEKILLDLNENERMSGNEQYEILGNLLTETQVKHLIYSCKNRILTADCVEKSHLVWFYLKDISWKIVIGSIKVFSKDMKATYGHDFNPPRELHCWLEKENKIIDIALPGLIIRGLRAKDEIGSFLEGRTPIILAGEVPNWIIYNAKDTLT